MSLHSMPSDHCKCGDKRSFQKLLDRQLGPEFLSHRMGGGGRVTYLEGRTAIELANTHFGYDGWSSELRSSQVDFIEEQGGRVNVGVTAVVRVTLRDGSYHEDVGYGSAQNINGKAAALEKAKKEASTDALKRALRLFGNVLGNCLYDKYYLSQVGKIKYGQIPFDPSNLYRHPGLRLSHSTDAQSKPTVSTMSSCTYSAASIPAPPKAPSFLLPQPSPQDSIQNQPITQVTSQVTSTSVTPPQNVLPACLPVPSTPSTPSTPSAPPALPKTSPDTTTTVSTNGSLIPREDSFGYEGEEELFAQLAETDFYVTPDTTETTTSVTTRRKSNEKSSVKTKSSIAIDVSPTEYTHRAMERRRSSQNRNGVASKKRKL